MGAQALNPYWALRFWDKTKTRFPDVRGEEDAYYPSLLCMEQQIGYMASRHAGLSDEDVALALAICGLNVAAFLEKRELPERTGFSPAVEELSNRCMATFHPDYNPQLAELLKRARLTPEDEQHHYRTAGSVLRRLSDSCKYWSKAGGRRGYIKFVTSFLQEAGITPKSDKVDFVFASKRPLPGLENAFKISPKR